MIGSEIGNLRKKFKLSSRLEISQFFSTKSKKQRKSRSKINVIFKASFLQRPETHWKNKGKIGFFLKFRAFLYFVLFRLPFTFFFNMKYLFQIQIFSKVLRSNPKVWNISEMKKNAN